MTEPTLIEFARRWLAGQAVAARAAGIDGRPAAVGWATVDKERAAGEFAAGAADTEFAAAPGTSLLGARCQVARDLLPDGVALALIEPDTEGRLAATLARLGEGPVALWLSVPDLGAASAALHRAGVATSASRPGPFGPERLVLGGAIAGPHRLVVQLGGYHPSMTETAQVSLRPARQTDAPAIAALFTDEGYPAGPSDVLTRLGRFDGSKSRVIVAEHDDVILGFIAVHAMARFEHDDWILRILALVVDAGARERGVGRALMSEAERIGVELGAAFVELTAGHHRPEARQLFESVGYDSTVTAYLRKKL